MKFPIITFIGILAFITYYANAVINQLDNKPIDVKTYEVVQYFPMGALDYDN